MTEGRSRRFSVVHTGDASLPYEVIDSQRYGDVMACCRTRAVALLLAKGLNETRPDRRQRADRVRQFYAISGGPDE